MKSFVKKVEYDAENDIMKISFQNNSGSWYPSEGPIGIEVMKDNNTNDVAGFVVYYAKSKMANRQKTLDTLPYNINLLEMFDLINIEI